MVRYIHLSPKDEGKSSTNNKFSKISGSKINIENPVALEDIVEEIGSI